MTSKVHLALFLLFTCTVTVSVVEDNFQGENGEKFSQQNGPSYTYEIIRETDRQVIWSDDEHFNRSLIIFSNSSISKFSDIGIPRFFYLIPQLFNQLYYFKGSTFNAHLGVIFSAGPQLSLDTTIQLPVKNVVSILQRTFLGANTFSKRTKRKWFLSLS